MIFSSRNSSGKKLSLPIIIILAMMMMVVTSVEPNKSDIAVSGDHTGPCPTGYGNTAEELAKSTNVDLTGKVALVTGGRSGIGFEIAKSFLGQGATVIIASRNLARNALAVKKLKDQFGNNADISFMTFDLELLDSVRELCNEFMDKYDRLDYLFLNAATDRDLQSTEWSNDNKYIIPTPITSDGYDSVFQTNYIGQVLMAESLLPLLRETDGPSRVILSASATHAEACFALFANTEHSDDCFGDVVTSLDLMPLTNPWAYVPYFESSYPIGKYLQIQMAKEWAKRYGGDDVHAYSFGPGNIKTALNPNPIPNTQDESIGGDHLFFLPYVGPINATTGMPVFDDPPGFTFFNSPAHGAKAAIYQALMAPEEDAGSFTTTFWECEPNKGTFSQGITDEIRSNIYDASLMWLGLADDNSTNSGDGVDENDNDNDVSIFDLACSNDDFTTLCSLVETCIDSFDADEIYTVFAPTDEAFEALDEEVGGLDTVDEDTLCDILKYHVVAGKAIYSNDKSCESGPATLIKMMNGVDARIKCTNGTPYGIKGGGNDEPVNFVDVDIEATDGVIHSIDGVLFIRD